MSPVAAQGTIADMVRYQVGLEDVTARSLDGFFEGWPNPPAPAAALAALSASSHVVVAFDGDAVVGFANALSDGVLSAYIPLLEVRRAYRHRGIGTALVQTLLRAIGDVYAVDVVCDEDVAAFYERLGLQRLVGMARRNRAARALG